MAKTTRHYRFELPYRIAAPVLADAGTGIDRVLLRGRRDRRTGTVTLLDTTDERLSWAGILLAHSMRTPILSEYDVPEHEAHVNFSWKRWKFLPMDGLHIYSWQNVRFCFDQRFPKARPP